LSIQPAFPKPGKKKPVAIKIYRDGRMVCNLNTKEGQDEYDRLRLVMYERQKGICPLCRKRLEKKWMQFDHTTPRGHGGGFRDDRIEVNGVWQNQAVHPLCNIYKGSRRNVEFLDVP
jgi:hypothetical protein